jgi:hypothetical protein
MISSPLLATPVHRPGARRAPNVSLSADCAPSARHGSELAQLTNAVVAARAALETAMRREHDQECARSAAEATGIDAWGAAAREHLHQAICAVRQARADLIAAQAAEHTSTESS